MLIQSTAMIGVAEEVSDRAKTIVKISAAERVIITGVVELAEQKMRVSRARSKTMSFR